MKNVKSILAALLYGACLWGTFSLLAACSHDMPNNLIPAANYSQVSDNVCSPSPTGIDTTAGISVQGSTMTTSAGTFTMTITSVTASVIDGTLSQSGAAVATFSYRTTGNEIDIVDDASNDAAGLKGQQQSGTCSQTYRGQ